MTQASRMSFAKGFIDGCLRCWLLDYFSHGPFQSVDSNSFSSVGQYGFSSSKHFGRISNSSRVQVKYLSRFCLRVTIQSPRRKSISSFLQKQSVSDVYLVVVHSQTNDISKQNQQHAIAIATVDLLSKFILTRAIDPMNINQTIELQSAVSPSLWLLCLFQPEIGRKLTLSVRISQTQKRERFSKMKLIEICLIKIAGDLMKCKRSEQMREFYMRKLKKMPVRFFFFSFVLCERVSEAKSKSWAERFRKSI